MQKSSKTLLCERIDVQHKGGEGLEKLADSMFGIFGNNRQAVTGLGHRVCASLDQSKKVAHSG